MTEIFLKAAGFLLVMGELFWYTEGRRASDERYSWARMPRASGQVCVGGMMPVLCLAGGSRAVRPDAAPGDAMGHGI
ncbi:hypothetical protein [Selenomonas bovis]|uniref:hypothetical protein n=1 Tax=Selenomonas bovis TaxID=416586 RepID=UPI0012DEF7F9|nr:hypothetical protein [Selenomonas bovis]